MVAGPCRPRRPGRPDAWPQTGSAICPPSPGALADPRRPACLSRPRRRPARSATAAPTPVTTWTFWTSEPTSPAPRRSAPIQPWAFLFAPYPSLDLSDRFKAQDTRWTDVTDLDRQGEAT